MYACHGGSANSQYKQLSEPCDETPHSDWLVLYYSLVLFPALYVPFALLTHFSADMWNVSTTIVTIVMNKKFIHRIQFKSMLQHDSLLPLLFGLQSHFATFPTFSQSWLQLCVRVTGAKHALSKQLYLLTQSNNVLWNPFRLNFFFSYTRFISHSFQE